MIHCLQSLLPASFRPPSIALPVRMPLSPSLLPMSICSALLELTAVLPCDRHVTHVTTVRQGLGKGDSGDTSQISSIRMPT